MRGVPSAKLRARPGEAGNSAALRPRAAGGPSVLSPAAARSGFFQARLASAVAIAPLGVWTFIHLWHNLSAFEGADAWQTAVTQYAHPFAEGIAGILVLLPLAIHTVWGVSRLASSRPNNPRYRSYSNFKYVLQRIAAVGVLLFLGAHLWQAMVRPRLEGHPEPFAHIAQYMHFHTPTLVVYLLGTLGVAYHLANGVHTACMSWGLVSSQRALRRLEAVAVLLMLLLLAMSWGTIYALWSAGAAP
jgi:succinate dehydrogenase / fumarate reductase cytochrome b subunit